MLRKLCIRILAASIVALLSSTPGLAATLSFTLDPFTGDDSEARVTLDDAAAGAGNIQISVEVTTGVADIRGILFDLADDSLLAGLVVSGGDVTDVAFGSVIDLGNGANLRGGGTPCPCDVGVEIGRPGLRGGSDDFQSTTIVLTHETLGLDLSIFDAQQFGLRLTSVGPDEDHRGGSAKLGGVVPEPSTGLLLGLGLLALARRSR